VDVARPTGADSVKDGRGLGVADFNGDGRLDLVINNNNETPSLYLNSLSKSGNAVEFKLVGTRSNRDAIGARVRLTAGGKTMTRQIEAGSGYASQGTLSAHFGIGGESIEAVEIVWPSGTVQRIAGADLNAMVGVNSLVHIEESGGANGVVATRLLPRMTNGVVSR
jgi:hypothetical protein